MFIVRKAVSLILEKLAFPYYGCCYLFSIIIEIHFCAWGFAWDFNLVDLFLLDAQFSVYLKKYMWPMALSQFRKISVSSFNCVQIKHMSLTSKIFPSVASEWSISLLVRVF